MASAAGMVAGGLFNAFAFAGAGFLFSSFNNSHYDSEMKRHDLAEEKPDRARFGWNKNLEDVRNKILKKRREFAEAKDDLQSVDRSRAAYGRPLRQHLRAEYQIVKYNRRPELSDFYQPPDEMKK